jgi:hypothetical protein
MSESKVPACITSRIKPKKKKLRVSNKPKAKNAVRNAVAQDILDAVCNPTLVGVELSFVKRSDGRIILHMESSTNGMRMLEIPLNVSQFGRLISTQGAIEVQAEMGAVSIEQATSVKHTEKVTLPKSWPAYRTRGHIRAALDEAGYKDWEIYSDGLSSQQNGTGHQCVVIRFERIGN